MPLRSVRIKGIHLRGLLVSAEWLPPFRLWSAYPNSGEWILSGRVSFFHTDNEARHEREPNSVPFVDYPLPTTQSTPSSVFLGRLFPPLPWFKKPALFFSSINPSSSPPPRRVASNSETLRRALTSLTPPECLYGSESTGPRVPPAFREDLRRGVQTWRFSSAFEFPAFSSFRP